MLALVGWGCLELSPIWACLTSLGVCVDFWTQLNVLRTGVDTSLELHVLRTQAVCAAHLSLAVAIEAGQPGIELWSAACKRHLLV